jgi:uncharacterized protein (TIGR02246 family)
MSAQTAQRIDTWIDSHANDDAAIRDLYQRMMDGWNKGSGEAFAAPFAEESDFIGFDGTHLKGCRDIASFHQRVFDKYLKRSRLVGEVRSVRFLTPDVAIMHAVGGTVMPRKSAPAPERDSRRRASHPRSTKRIRTPKESEEDSASRPTA